MKLPPSAARRYEVETVLASGGFGHVLKARDRELDRTVAIKVLTSAALSDVAQVQRFREEGRITAALEHPNIVRVLDQGLEEGVPWIVYELVTGGTLRGALEKAGRFTPEAAVQAAWQVAAALDAAHARGVLHRDVKPENVLAASPAHWKLTDFGIARWAGREGVHTATGVVLGTPVYLAPDLVRGEEASAATDLYALGVMLFELIAGAPPFEAESPLLLMERHLESRPPLDRLAAPPAVVDLVGRLLAKEGADRPASAAQVMAALKGNLSDRQAADRTGRISRPARSPVRPSPAAPVAGSPRSGSRVRAVVAAAALCGLAFGAHRALAPRAAPKDPAARLAELKTAGDAAWDAEARALCPVLTTVPMVDELADVVRRRHGTLLVGRPPWVVALARARAALDGSTHRVAEMDRIAARTVETQTFKSQNVAFACLEEQYARHGDGAGALLGWRLLSWSISQFDHERRLYYDGQKHGHARAFASGDEEVPKPFHARWWLPIALGALESGEPLLWFKFTAVTNNLIESLSEGGQDHVLRPVLDALPALRACYPESSMLDLAEASAAGARRDVPAMRAAFRRGGERVAAQYLKKGLRSGVQELECWAELINRVLRSAYTLRQPELIEDAQREYDRLVPPGTPLDTHTPAQVIEAEKKIKVYRADASKRKR